jgi:spore maturation protein CgeB
MRFVIFGLTVSSSWGNGHATTWRGVLRALARGGHTVTFFERDVPYYAARRDLPNPDYLRLVLYPEWGDVLDAARRAVAEADVAMVTSYCPDGVAAAELVLDQARALRVFYDIDTPVTLAALAAHGIAVPNGAHYLTRELVPEYDLYLTFTGGPMLDELRTRWGARRTAPLYCSVDPESHRPVPARDEYRCALGYLGTYAPDRQPSVDRFLVHTALRCPEARFGIAGSLYPPEIVWPDNVFVTDHLPPADHSAFYCSNRVTLNVTREAMRQSGYSPSVRLFEAGSCGTPIVSDTWPGLDAFFRPGEEILVAENTEDVQRALQLSDAELQRIAAAARTRTLAAHTATARAIELVDACHAAAAATAPVQSAATRSLNGVAGV